MKWDMGWMHDTLEYFARDPIHRAPPPRRAHLPRRLRVQRELRAAAVPRRGRARKGLAAGEDAGRPMAAARQPATPARLRLGAAGEEAALHGWRAGAGGEWDHDGRSTGTLEHLPPTPGSRAGSADLNRALPRPPRPHQLDSDPDGFRWTVADDGDNSTLTFLRHGRDGSPLLFVALISRRSPPRLRASGSARRLLARALEQRRPALRRDGHGNVGGVEATPVPAHGRPVSLTLTLPPLCPSSSSPTNRGRDTRSERRRLTRTGRMPAGGVLPVWAPGRRASRSCSQGRSPARSPSRRGDELRLSQRLRSPARPRRALSLPLDGGPELPDPASRSQPERRARPVRGGRPAAFPRGPTRLARVGAGRYVCYELHVGTFTPDGTFDARSSPTGRARGARRHRDRADAGGAIPGERNWGYDGVFPFAAQSSYGGPAACARLVDACHARGLAVALDVVYNHLGPEGNYLASSGRTSPIATGLRGVRRSTSTVPGATRSAATSSTTRCYWVEDFHVDALRLDAIHAIADTAARPLPGGADRGRGRAAAARPPSRARDRGERTKRRSTRVRPRIGGRHGLDAQWNDDFHHALHAC